MSDVRLQNREVKMQNIPPNNPAKRPDWQPLDYEQAKDKERGGCLTAYLIVSFAFSLFALYTWFNIFQTLNDNPALRARVPIIGVVFLLIVIVASLAGVAGTWGWKRWGVYLLGAISIISPVVETILGVATPSDYVAPVIQLLVLYFLVNKRWKEFD